MTSVREPSVNAPSPGVADDDSQESDLMDGEEVHAFGLFPDGPKCLGRTSS